MRFLKIIVDTNLSLAEKKGQKLKLKERELEPDCSLLVDLKKFRSVVENLLSNAIKYSPKESKIKITVEQESKFVVIKVEDEGPGLSEEDQKKLFRKFQKLSSQSTGGESSSGLGLYIVKQIVELHGGVLQVESQLNKGSVFSVRMPLVDRIVIAFP